ncbi:hypothetical protein E2562_002894 [Oryza meyeriana var. granulata]|uniref:Uncharacterized protein n=1 Tax=Oryza meyeriana var. granulata TaxID=110450 RepID=A0A6G1DDF8_9ORYZ|nr:hypothetical protein E2562_002894 [Oryza meyeriana var. granulata]
MGMPGEDIDVARGRSGRCPLGAPALNDADDGNGDGFLSPAACRSGSKTVAIASYIWLGNKPPPPTPPVAAPCPLAGLPEEPVADLLAHPPSSSSLATGPQQRLRASQRLHWRAVEEGVAGMMV